VVFSWRPADAAPHNPLTTPWPDADELIEGVEFAAEAAARRFDLDRTVGESGRPVGGDVADAGPWLEFFTWEEAARWLEAPGDGSDRRPVGPQGADR
jgi:hypothetical protein